MTLAKTIKKMNTNIYNKLFYLITIRNEKKKINDEKRVNLYKKICYTKFQNKKINDYFIKNYGKKVDTRWHRLYQSFTGKFDKKYFPEILFSSELEPLLCDRKIAAQLTDKSMVELLYKGIEDLYIPKTYILCCSGIFYDGNRNIISKEEAIKVINNCGKVVFKKTIDSCSGRGVLLVNIKNGRDIKNNLSLEELMKEFGKNFIVQEIITNCDEIKNIYPKSLNTFRIMTYVVNGKLYHVPIAMRIGQGNNEVDNIHAGGMFIGVSDEGVLMDKAFTEFQNVYEEHPDSHLVFKNYKIHNIDKMIQIAYKCHGRTPHMGIISWDFTIDDKNRIVLIEVNLNGQSIWFPQMANGKSAFGDNTEYMLSLISKRGKKKCKKLI